MPIKSPLLIYVLLAFFCVPYKAWADNIIRTPAPIGPSQVPAWEATDPFYGVWTNSGSPFGCTSKIPLENTIEIGVSFTQNLSGCSQEQTRTIQPRILNKTTGEIKNSGSVMTESRVLTGIAYGVQAIGTNETIPNSYSIVPGQQVNYGAGYLRQIGGTYNFGHSMQKTPNGYQTYFALTTWSGIRSINFSISTGSGINITNTTKYDSSAYSQYIAPFNGIKLYNSNGDLVKQYLFTQQLEENNYYQKYLNINQAEYDSLYALMPTITRVKLF